MKKLLVVAALCAASFAFTCAADTRPESPKAWAFQGATIDSLIAQLKPGATLTLRFDAAGTPWLKVDGNAALDESRPCPPFTGCQ